jgi:hypothetical protein
LLLFTFHHSHFTAHNPISVIGIFKQKNPINFILLFIFGLLIKLPIFSTPQIPLLKDQDGVFYTAIIRFLNPYSLKFSALYGLLAFLFLFLQAALLNGFMNKQRMLNRQNYLPGMSYLLITSLFPEWNQFSAPLLATTFLLVILNGLFNTYNQENAKAAVFNNGFLLGIASLLFFPSLAFVFWIFFAMMVIRPFRLNEWLLCILGIMTPAYFYAVYLFLTDQWSWQALVPKLYPGFPKIDQTILLAGSMLLLIVPFLTGSWYVQDNLRKVLINIRKAWSLFLLYMLAAMVVPFLQTSENFENWILIAVPFAAFHSSAYAFTVWRLIPLLFFWLSVAFILFSQYYAGAW